MKLVLISDTHSKHEQVQIPACDVLIHAGDLTMRGSYSATQSAIDWLDKQPAKHIVLVAGNHDFYFEKRAVSDILPPHRFHYLEHNGVEIYGLRFWGSPYTPEFHDWAFMYDRAYGQQVWSDIPEDTDILITHGPPRGMLDVVNMSEGYLGCYDLANRIEQLKQLKLHVFGHIHAGHGHVYDQYRDLHYYNASVVNEAYNVVHEPFVVNL